MKAILYVRVSSKEQEKEGYSLDAQEKLGYDYAAKKGFQIAKCWKVSESAWKQEREAFNQVIEYSKRHKEIEHIIFDVTDRMTRNDFDKLKIYTLIKEHNKTIHFSRSNKIFNKYSGPDDEFVMDIEVAVAKKMSNDISRKTKMGMQEKAEQGIYPSIVPFGYINNKASKVIELDETRAPYIKRTFELFATGNYSLRMIVNILFNEGFRGKKDNKVGLSIIHKILNSIFYSGYFMWKGKLFKGSHPSIISKEMFDKVQAVFKREHHPYVSRKGFAFNNLMTCGICNCKVLGEIKKSKYTYYHCTFSKGKCGNGYVPEGILVEKFAEAIKPISITEDRLTWLRKTLKDFHKEDGQYQEKQNQVLGSEITKIKNRISALYDDKADGIINEDFWKEKSNKYQEDLIKIEAQKNKINTFKPEYYESTLRTFELCNRLNPIYVRADLEQKAKILKVLASNYSLINATLYPTYRRPFSFIAKWPSCSSWLPDRGRLPNFSVELIAGLNNSRNGQRWQIVY